ncbi:putative quinone oxidoreductase [Streptomyces sp. Tu6071]|uniref:quinone oxidoreductase family protein n=1 Tax=Streptomyces sp. Tu6071 TaxID=355249 RepID=UPI00020E5A87|nr:zinc-binding alcohol dehydrogenase family protein [Streptomyces sp. Tu6071]EGJ75885.1 putative quinone oxidoreductase [Streptomyces sp. Tu6071]
MRAALVRTFGTPPRYEEVGPPPAPGPGDVLVDVLAAGLHPRVRSAADGSHYTSRDELPLVPGIDGVGRTEEGELLYFVAPDTALGTLAERALVDRRRAVPLPAGTDPLAVAAGMNPAMSSWVALRRRVDFAPGSSVLVLGATGNAGRLAVQVARGLGAARVVGAGRDPHRLGLLDALGAEPLDLRGEEHEVAGRLGAAAGDVDVVLDYLWGAPTERAVPALLTARTDRSRPLTWIQLGSVAGPELTLSSAWLRAGALSFVGSGQGSVTTAGIVAELPALAEEIVSGRIDVRPVARPLARVHEVWGEEVAAGERVVLVP